MMNLDDLKEEAKQRAPKKRHTLVFDIPLWNKMDSFRAEHGEETTAEVLRRAIDAGLDFADKELKPKKK